MIRRFVVLVCSVFAGACDEIGSIDAALDAGPGPATAPDATSPRTADAGAPGVVCDPRAPSCAADEKCVSTHWDFSAPWPAPRCTPNKGEQGLDENAACFSAVGRYDYCGDGLACTNYGTGEGFCRGLCNEAGTACGKPGSVCATVDPSSGFMLCLARCEDDEDCGLIGLFACVKHEGVKHCDASRALR